MEPFITRTPQGVLGYPDHGPHNELSQPKTRTEAQLCKPN